jgi:hypothetical protein
LIAKVATDVPAAMVTLVGIEAFPELLESFTIIPPVGADPGSVTVPVEGNPQPNSIALTPEL